MCTCSGKVRREGRHTGTGPGWARWSAPRLPGPPVACLHGPSDSGPGWRATWRKPARSAPVLAAGSEGTPTRCASCFCTSSALKLPTRASCSITSCACKGRGQVCVGVWGKGWRGPCRPSRTLNCLMATSHKPPCPPPPRTHKHTFSSSALATNFSLNRMRSSTTCVVMCSARRSACSRLRPAPSKRLDWGVEGWGDGVKGGGGGEHGRPHAAARPRCVERASACNRRCSSMLCSAAARAALRRHAVCAMRAAACSTGLQDSLHAWRPPFPPGRAC